MIEHKFVHLIADYGNGDPAFSEVIQKLYQLDPAVTVIPTGVPKFSTLATGFWTFQLAMVNPIPGMVIYTNTAPRKDKKTPRDQGEGEGLVYAELKNTIRIVGVNSGYCFSFVKPLIKSLRTVKVANKGSQFRSRDFYPEAVIKILQGDTALFGPEKELQDIPDVPDRRIGYIDGYGNLKTTVRHSSVQFKPGQALVINLNNLKRTAYFTEGSFSVHEGELAFSPGSSGGDDRFMEIFLRGLSAWKEFGKPRIEDAFTIEPA